MRQNSLCMRNCMNSLNTETYLYQKPVQSNFQLLFCTHDRHDALQMTIVFEGHVNLHRLGEVAVGPFLCQLLLKLLS